MDVPGFYGHYTRPTTTTVGDGVSVTFSEPLIPVNPPEPVKRRPLANPVLAERDRCLAILRKLQAECNPTDPEELFGFNRLGRAISAIENGGK